MSTLVEIVAAVQQLPRAAFLDWFHSFDAMDWDQQMEDDMTAGNLEWLANEASAIARLVDVLNYEASGQPTLLGLL